MLKKENLIKLAETRSEWCVSLYMPINRANTQQNKLRLKNLMFDAEKQLLELGLYPLRVARILAPIAMLLDNPGFWKDRREGFAAFLTLDSFVWFPLPCQTEELVVIADRFHLKPLLRIVSQSNSFYLLTLSHKQIRFYEASQAGINEVFLRGMPRSLDHFLLSFELEKQLQMHSAGTAATIFHGHGGVEDNKKLKIAEVFRKVNKIVSDFLKNEDKPLILAGVEYLHPLYQSVNSYRNIVEEGVTGNVDNLSPKHLLEKVLPFINPVFRREQKKAAEQYRKRLGTGLASNNLEEILPASHEGRVESLFVSATNQVWGKFNVQANSLEIRQNQQPGDNDLLCVAAINTLLTGGKSFVLLPEEMPDKSPAAAILRF